VFLYLLHFLHFCRFSLASFFSPPLFFSLHECMEEGDVINGKWVEGFQAKTEISLHYVELISTEKKYVSHLKNILEWYINPLKVRAAPIQSQAPLGIMFPYSSFIPNNSFLQCNPSSTANMTHDGEIHSCVCCNLSFFSGATA
jgi:hypothetical protein